MTLLPVMVVACLVLYVFAFALPPFSVLLDRTQLLLKASPSQALLGTLEAPLEAWLREEAPIALDKLLANVAPGGRHVKTAAAGSVIASPSKKHPDYYYQWVRDAAITTAALVDIYADDSHPNISSTLSSILDSYTSLSHRIQHASNPSGTFSDLSGLGEPKFHADGSAFRGSWGRPQRDGPALRALTLIEYLRVYNASHPEQWQAPRADWFKPLYDPTMPPESVIKADLEYISHYWYRSGFDVWEEVDGMHFFTLMVTRRALREGTDLAYAFGDDGAARWYKFQANEVDKYLRKFWDEEKQHLVSTLESSRSGLDCSLLLGSLHGNAPNSTAANGALFPPHSDELLLSLLTLATDQAKRFPINSSPRQFFINNAGKPKPLSGTGIGRYPEDVYDGYGNTPEGGNPWFLCTCASAQVLYETAAHLLRTQTLTVSPLGFPFYAALLSPSSAFHRLEAGSTYSTTDRVFVETVRRLKEVGDEFLDVVKWHADAEGGLSEQFDRVTGFERGARDLTWSYGAFLQAFWARERVLGL